MAQSESRRQIWIHALGAKAGGGITYLQSVLPELFRQLEGTGARVILMLPRELPDVAIPSWCEVRLYPTIAYNPLVRLLFDQVVLPLQLFGRKADCLFCSGNFPPLLKPIRTVVLIRNAIYFEQDFLKRERRLRRVLLKLQGALIRRAARGCVALHYPSAYMRRVTEVGASALVRSGVLNYYGIAKHMLAARDGERPPRVTSPDWATFLYVMNYTRQKNVGFLVRALAQARHEGLKVRVVVTSDLRAPGRDFSAEDRAIIDRHNLINSGYLIPIGATYGPDLVRLYHQLDACVFPSVCESFGHPLVEALAIGKPIACADREYAREICGDHAVYVDPDRPEALVDLWRRWPEVARSFARPPLEALTSTYSWERHVTRLLQDLLPQAS